jgi:hypothetical protein
MFHLPWSMVLHRLLQDSLLFLLRPVLLLVVVIPGVAWKGRTPVLAVSMPVRVVVGEDLIVVIMIIVLVVMLVGSTVGPLVHWRRSVLTRQSCLFCIVVSPRWFPWRR